MCKIIYAGSEPSSEPETKAVINFIKSLSNKLISYVSLHSYGGLWLFWNESTSFDRLKFLDVVDIVDYE